jgi:hypothetical protein
MDQFLEPDFSREMAAYERYRAQLERDHPDKIALIHGDDLVGVFDTLLEAMAEGRRRFGLEQSMVKEIGDPEHFMPLAVFPDAVDRDGSAQ